MRAARDWERILNRRNAASPVGIQFLGMSPLHWTRREYNQQADFLCHHTLEKRQSWQEVLTAPVAVDYRNGDFVAAWSDGGYDSGKGETAGFVISLRRGGQWMTLERGGVFMIDAKEIDSFFMEAVGLERCVQQQATWLNYVSENVAVW